MLKWICCWDNLGSQTVDMWMYPFHFQAHCFLSISVCVNVLDIIHGNSFNETTKNNNHSNILLWKLRTRFKKWQSLKHQFLFHPKITN